MSYSRSSRYSRSPSPYKSYRRSVSRSLSRSRSRSRSAESEVENPGNNLYVTGLSPRITKRELEKHFASEGNVIDVRLVVDPWTRESRGFGFVTMATNKEADRCIKNLDRSVLEGRIITVEKFLWQQAKRRKGRTPTPGRYLGLRTIRVRRRSPSYSPHRSPSYSTYSRSRSRSPHYSSDRSRSRSRSPDDRYYRKRDRSYTPDDLYYRRRDRSYSPDDRYYRRHDRSYSPEDHYSRSRDRFYSPYDSRYNSPDDRFYRRHHSVSRSPMPPWARRGSRRSYSRSISPKRRTSSRGSYSRSTSPVERRSRRSYSRSISPPPRRSTRSSMQEVSDDSYTRSRSASTTS